MTVNNITTFILFLCAIGWIVNAFAISNQPNLHCPDIYEIQKNHITHKWNAQNQFGTWKSYQTSFATDLTQFVGAQWIGESVGQLTCIYKAEQRFTMEGHSTIQPALPVRIVFYALAYQPTHGKWKHVGQGIYNCNAYTQKHCSFKVRLKKQSRDIYQEAESLKTSNTDMIHPESY